jgi:hypothetical protein
MILVTQDPEPEDESLFDQHTVFEVSGEVRVLMDRLLDMLSFIVDGQVTGDDLALALKSLRENDGLDIQLDNTHHQELLVQRLVEMKDPPIF